MSTSASAKIPELVFLNRQRAVRVSLASLKSFAQRVLPLCAANSADGAFALRSIPEVVVTLVSDRRIDQIHRQFMNIPGATDVITFEHGEIVISAQTAERCALEFGHSLEDEIGLYVVHGLLHLNGYLDGAVEDRERMHAVQNKIWQSALPV
jgi:probable rRNA maturation factor